MENQHDSRDLLLNSSDFDGADSLDSAREPAQEAARRVTLEAEAASGPEAIVVTQNEWPELRRRALTRGVGEPAPLAPRSRVRPSEPAPAMDRVCPKCASLNARTDVECRSCRVVFERFRDLEDERMLEDLALAGGSHELLRQWQDTIANYSQLELHEHFVMECMRRGALAFAAQKYRLILQAAPSEETAGSMYRRVVGMTMQKLERRRAIGGWSYRIPMLNGLVILLSTVVLTVGLFLHPVRALTGVGMAGLALAFAIRYFSRSER